MSSLNQPLFWKQYSEYLLKSTSKDTASDRIQYAKKYHYILINGNAQDLLSLTNEKRLHIMKALTKLSKYLGEYNRWEQIKSRYQLKWSQENSLDVFKRMIDTGKNLSSMINWVRNAYKILPTEYANIIAFCTLTGLRPSEACESIRLIHENHTDYLNKKLMILEHFKFPEIFIRRTKKEYISVASPTIMKLARESKVVGYDAIKLITRKYGIRMDMSYCRKIFATYLRINGIESETIDLLQGRIPKSIFVKHYFRPDMDYRRVRLLQQSLVQQLHLNCR